MYLPNRSTDPGMLACMRFKKCHWVLVIGSQHMAKQILPSAGPLLGVTKPVAWNLSVWFDFGLDLCFEQHNPKLVQSCFYHLKNISKIQSILTFKDTETILHASIWACLDYCNSLFTCKKIYSKTLLWSETYESTPDCTELSCQAFNQNQETKWSHYSCFSCFTLAPIWFRIDFFYFTDYF